MRRKAADEKRGLKVSFCCSKVEYAAILALWDKTICQSFSEYARKILLAKPVTVKYRNISLDRLIDTMNELRNELEKLTDRPAIGVSDQPKLLALLQEIKIIFHQIANQCIPK